MHAEQNLHITIKVEMPEDEARRLDDVQDDDATECGDLEEAEAGPPDHNLTRLNTWKSVHGKWVIANGERAKAIES